MGMDLPASGLRIFWNEPLAFSQMPLVINTYFRYTYTNEPALENGWDMDGVSDVREVAADDHGIW